MPSELVSVIAATAAAWIFGAVWYGIVAKPWMAAVGLTEDTINRKNYVAFAGSFVAAILVAGMTRHILNSQSVHTGFGGLLSGIGLGLFIATPWIATNYLFAQRKSILIAIDGMYATVGCALIGLVVTML